MSFLYDAWPILLLTVPRHKFLAKPDGPASAVFAEWLESMAAVLQWLLEEQPANMFYHSRDDLYAIKQCPVLCKLLWHRCYM